MCGEIQALAWSLVFDVNFSIALFPVATRGLDLF